MIVLPQLHCNDRWCSSVDTEEEDEDEGEYELIVLVNSGESHIKNIASENVVSSEEKVLTQRIEKYTILACCGTGLYNGQPNTA